MACEYCLSNDLEDTWRCCPMCGQKLETIKGLRLLYKIGNEFLATLERRIVDEDGKPMWLDSTLDMSTDFSQPAFETASFDPDNVDISRELNWLKLHSDAERIINEE